MYAYVITQINIWLIPTLTPILLNKQFGIGKEFAFSLGLQWLPSILLGPITAMLIKRWGSHKIYMAVMFFYSMILFALPFTAHLLHIQLLIFGLGIGQAIASPSSLTLRAYVIPEGMEIAGNSIIIGIQRLSKMIGPLVAGLLIFLFNADTAFFISGLLCYPSIIALMAIPLKKHKVMIEEAKKDVKSKTSEFFHLFFTFFIQDKLLLGLFVTAIGYTITLGALKIYLFTLADLMGDSERVYSLLLASQGFGALMGAVFSQKMIAIFQYKLTLPKIYAIVSILEGSILLFVNINHHIVFVTCILIFAAVFETLAFVTYFTLLQKTISKEQQGVFNSVTMPIIDSSYLVGVMLIGFIIDRYSLSFILWITVSFTIGTVLMFIKTFFKESDRRISGLGTEK